MANLGSVGGHTIEVPEPKRSDFPQHLGGAIAWSLAWLVYHVVKVMSDGVAWILKRGFEFAADLAGPYVRRAMKPLTDLVLARPDVPASVKALLRESLAEGGFDAGVLTIPLILMAIGPFVQAILAPILRRVSMEVDHVIHSNKPGPGDLYAMYWREQISEHDLAKDLSELGYADGHIHGYQEIIRPRPSPWEMMAWYLRKDKTVEGATGDLRLRGYSPLDQAMMKTLAYPIPGASDLVRFGLREVWKPEIVQKYGYDQELDGTFVDWMARVGYTEDWTKAYWRAHWEIPSPAAGYEMLHRGIITMQDLKDLLKIQDYAPWWRQKMVDVAYTPFTRVDVRRMYATGVLKTVDEVITAYRDIGYNAEKAGKLAEFTIAEYGEKELDATKSDILDGYDLGRLSRLEARDMLLAIGKQAWIVEVYLARSDLAKANRLATEEVKHVKALYVGRAIDVAEVYTRLGKIPLPAAEIAGYLEEWDIGMRTATKKPGLADLKRFLLQGILGIATLEAELRAMGYDPKYVSWYIRSLQEEYKQAVDAEAEAARRRAEQLAREVTVRAERVEIAALDVRIAEYAVTIADYNAALLVVKTIEEIEALRRSVTEKEAAIARLQDEIATLQVSIADLKVLQTQAETPEEVDAIRLEIVQTQADIARLTEQIAALRVTIADLTVALQPVLSDVERVRLMNSIRDTQALIARAKLDKAAVHQKYSGAK